MTIDSSKMFKDYENSKLVTFREYGKNSEDTYALSELHKHEIEGIPMMMQEHDGKLYTTFTPDTHALIIGATRSGKTTGYIIPTLFAMAKKKNKPSMFVSDPKGELYARTAKHFKDNGYRVMLFNLRDDRHTECWNLLTPIFRKFKQMQEVENLVTVVMDENGTPKNSFMGRVCQTQEELDKLIRLEKSSLRDAMKNLIDELALIVVKPNISKDPYWDDSARDLFKLILEGMLDDSTGESGLPLITEENFSMSTLIRIYDSMASTYPDSDNRVDKNWDAGYLTGRMKNPELQKRGAAFGRNATSTLSCIMNSLSTQLTVFKESVVKNVTSCNSFEFKDLANDDQPTVMFIQYRDEVKTGYEIIRLFITAAYNALIEQANTCKGYKLRRPFYFMLDEFGNFPAITDFDTTISACGGRNIWFLIVLQSYAQLYHVYSRDVAQIIKDNLNMHVFYGTNNHETKEEFSRECGKKTIISPMSAVNGNEDRIQSFHMDTIALIPVSRLNKFAEGECIITRSNEDAVLHSKFVRSYCSSELMCEESNPKEYVVSIDFYDDKYQYMPRLNSRGFVYSFGTRRFDF